MKNLLLLLASLLLISCGPDLDDTKELDAILEEALPEEKVQRRGGKKEKLYFETDKQEPYTGWLKVMHANGQVQGLAHVKEGKRHGPLLMWYENGQKAAEIQNKEGKMITAKGWLPDGSDCPITDIQNGTGTIIIYHESGKERRRQLFKNGSEVFN